jgi:hypothetical protein
MSILIRATRGHISEYGILHSYRRENFKSYIAVTGWTLQRRSNVFPVRYELSFYILHSQRRETLKSNIQRVLYYSYSIYTVCY